MELTLADFVLYLLSGAFALVVFITLLARTLHARADSRSLADRVICRLCLNAFEDHGHADMVNCPSCGAANEKGRSRRLG